MFNKALWTIGIVSLLPLVAVSQSSLDFSKLQMTVVAEQKDASLHFTKGSVGAMGGGDDFNGFSATSTDMGGGALGTVIILDQILPLEKAAKLADFQGRLEGEVKCKHIRRGDSPYSPNVHVLADGCSIVSLNH
jgi:hypothetical protein